MKTCYSRTGIANQLGLALKRTLDIMVAATGLILLIPLVAVTSVLICLDSPGPPIIGLWHIGRYGRKFREWKFRTMVRNAEELLPGLRHLNDMTGPYFKMRRDPRTTRVGRFLRRTSIDELPQLWNVLRGQMSLVGPRPMRLDDTMTNPQRRLFLSVRPGMTGLAQVYGRSALSTEKVVLYGLYYAEHWSLRLDLGIVRRTPATLWRDPFNRPNSPGSARTADHVGRFKQQPVG